MGIDPLSIALLAVSAVGTGASIYESNKAAGYQKQGVELQRQQASLQDARSKRDAIRASRLAFAQAQSAAENQGVASSSSSQGGLGSIVSQMSDNLSFLDTYGKITDQAQVALGHSISAESASHTFGSVANLAVSAYANAPEISKAAKKVFGH